MSGRLSKTDLATFLWSSSHGNHFSTSNTCEYGQVAAGPVHRCAMFAYRLIKSQGDFHDKEGDASKLIGKRFEWDGRLYSSRKLLYRHRYGWSDKPNRLIIKISPERWLRTANHHATLTLTRMSSTNPSQGRRRLQEGQSTGIREYFCCPNTGRNWQTERAWPKSCEKDSDSFAIVSFLAQQHERSMSMIWSAATELPPHKI